MLDDIIRFYHLVLSNHIGMTQLCKSIALLSFNHVYKKMLNTWYLHVMFVIQIAQ